MNDTITLIAGILLTSTGLLALLPFVLRLARHSSGAANPLQGPLLPALAAADAFLHPEVNFSAVTTAGEVTDGVNQEVEELMAHLFDLRMTVSELSAEVQNVQEAIASETPEEVASAPEQAEHSGETWYTEPDAAGERAA